MSGSSFKVRVIETSILFYISHLSSAPFASLHIFSLALSNHLNNYGFFLYQLCMHYIFSFASVYGNHFFFALSEQFRTAVFLLLICFNFVFIFVSLLCPQRETTDTWAHTCCRRGICRVTCHAMYELE